MTDADDVKMPLDDAIAALRPFLGLSDVLPTGQVQTGDVPIMAVRGVLRGVAELRPYAEIGRQLAGGPMPAAARPDTLALTALAQLTPHDQDDADAVGAAVLSLRLLTAIAETVDPPFRISISAHSAGRLADWLDEWNTIARDQDCGENRGALFARAYLASGKPAGPGGES